MGTGGGARGDEERGHAGGGWEVGTATSLSPPKFGGREGSRGTAGEESRQSSPLVWGNRGWGGEGYAGGGRGAGSGYRGKARPSPRFHTRRLAAHVVRAFHHLSFTLPRTPHLPTPQIFYQIFKQGCVKADGSRALFVDVGGNFGWFSVLGALMGCR